MRVALVQLDIAWEDPIENRRRAERRVREAAALGARLVILPEMFTCGFSMRAAELAEPEGGPTEEWMAEVASGMDVWILGGAPQQSPLGPRNRAILMSPAGAVQRFTKLHPFSFADEPAHYAAGDELVTWNVDGLRVTPFICYDLRFPEIFRKQVDRTDLYVVIANWPERRRAHWQALLLARAIENQAFVAGVNRVGDGDGMHYCGDSALISPWGERLAGGAEQEGVFVAEVSAAAVADARERFPVLKDRR
ncbi:MAG: carbon-nitrogen family hydrolase [Myxococcales bacterium]|nr:carbon-nitrogen family hydrolase [Myxococcales bacterium]